MLLRANGLRVFPPYLVLPKRHWRQAGAPIPPVICSSASRPPHSPLTTSSSCCAPKRYPARKGDFPEILSITPLPNGKYLHVVKDWFRRYDSPAESFLHHARLLTRNPRYRQALLHREDPLAFAHFIAQAGYATDPDYEGKLRRIISMIND